MTYISKKEQYRYFLKSETWKNKKQELFENRRNKHCAVCKTTENLHVHHLHYKRGWNPKIHNLMILCNEHHMMYHAHFGTKKQMRQSTIKFVREMQKAYKAQEEVDIKFINSISD